MLLRVVVCALPKKSSGVPAVHILSALCLSLWDCYDFTFANLHSDKSEKNFPTALCKSQA